MQIIVLSPGIFIQALILVGPKVEPKAMYRSW